jgi:hypothetical protein
MTADAGFRFALPWDQFRSPLRCFEILEICFLSTFERLFYTDSFAHDERCSNPLIAPRFLNAALRLRLP